jgi:hypothetical protein
MKIVTETDSGATLELSLEEAREIAVELEKNAKIVGAAGAELRKLLPEATDVPGGVLRYEYSGAEDLREA